ncbi:hypothetical protein C923_05098 [Plasmodium falciparum UGT5.1]|uniref:Surface antigen n=1 Tax=Plasmodium falciparum UGT5.1 TaxID=1237627 RepID=W7J5Q3_PLAFA|nr:hypothetical protein C923_05098 [Plasmodium falciparum UGT5.1]
MFLLYKLLILYIENVFGGGIAPSVGLLGGIGEAAISAWKVAALEAAIDFATEAGAAAGEAAGNARGVAIVLFGLNKLGVKDFCPDLFRSIGNTTPYNDSATIISAILAKKSQACSVTSDSSFKGMCSQFEVKFGLRLANGKPNGLPPNKAIPQKINELVGKAKGTAKAVADSKSAEVAAEITEQHTA